MTISNRLLHALSSELWAITPTALENIIAIANRENDTVEAVEKKIGKTLNNTQTVRMRGNTAIIPVSGPIFRYANLFTQISGATSIDVLARDFNEALENPKVKNIILEIDSPGGQVSGVAEFADMVRASKKHVTAYVSDLGASAAYWIASAANRIVLSQTSMVGSIGVVATLRRNQDKNTIEIVSSQSPNKRPDIETDEGRNEIQKNIDALGKIFVETVARNRGVNEETVLSDFGKGGLLVGSSAVSVKMADQVSSLENIIAGFSGNNRKSGALKMENQEPELTAENLKTINPNVYSEVLNAGKAQGAEEERERIKGVESQSMPGFESVVDSLKFDGKSTGADVAMKIIATQKEQMSLSQSNLSSNAPKPVKIDDGDDLPLKPDTKKMSIEERAKHDWDNDSSLSDEFSCVDAYAEYLRATESGAAKIFGKA